MFDKKVKFFKNIKKNSPAKYAKLLYLASSIRWISIMFDFLLNHLSDSQEYSLTTCLIKTEERALFRIVRTFNFKWRITRNYVAVII